MTRRLWLLIGAVVAGLVVEATAIIGFGAGLNVTSQNLTPFKTCTLTGYPNTTVADTDTYVNSSSTTTNFGTATTLPIQTGKSTNAGNANQRGYIRFDLTQCSPAIPSTALVRQATLRLYATAVQTTSCRTYDIFKVTATWSETTLTWNTQPAPATTAANTPATASRSASFTIGKTPCGATAAGYVPDAAQPDVTADVSSWVSGASSNFGWMIRDDTEGSTTSIVDSFATREANIAGEGPQLVITYVDVA